MRGTLNLPGKYSSILLQLLQLRNYRKANLWLWLFQVWEIQKY
jgi:hypothetical protein